MSGCLGQRTSACEGRDLFLGEYESPTEGAPVLVYAVRDEPSDQPLVVCARVNEGPVHELVMGQTREQPDVELITETLTEGRTFFVTAWLATAPEQHRRMTFNTTSENHVVIHVTSDDVLAIEKFEQRPTFA